jgi:hypothetical protein
MRRSSGLARSLNSTPGWAIDAGRMGHAGAPSWPWEEIRHPEHDKFSVAEMLEHERPHLMPMPTPFDGYVEKPARVSSTCLVSVARNRYSVPCELHVRISANVTDDFGNVTGLKVGAGLRGFDCGDGVGFVG